MKHLTDHKEILITIIKNDGECSNIAKGFRTICDKCPLEQLCYFHSQELTFNTKAEAVKMFIGKYGKEKLVEVLL